MRRRIVSSRQDRIVVRGWPKAPDGDVDVWEFIEDAITFLEENKVNHESTEGRRAMEAAIHINALDMNQCDRDSASHPEGGAEYEALIRRRKRKKKRDTS